MCFVNGGLRCTVEPNKTANRLKIKTIILRNNFTYCPSIKLKHFRFRLRKQVYSLQFKLWETSADRCPISVSPGPKHPIAEPIERVNCI